MEQTEISEMRDGQLMILAGKGQTWAKDELDRRRRERLEAERIYETR